MKHPSERFARAASASALCLLCLAASSGCSGDKISSDESGSVTPLSSPPHRIINGTPAIGRAFDPVVRIDISSSGLCSGTVIADEWVLTAAHCVFVKNCVYLENGQRMGCELLDRPEAFTISVRETSRRALQVRKASEVHPYPGYDDYGLIGDLALLRLESPFDNLTPIPALSDEPGLAWTAADVGIGATYVGFGLNENGMSGTRLTTSNQVDEVCLRDGQACAPFANPGTVCEQSNGSLTCNGDSGGPLLIERNGVTYVGAVTSYGDEQCASYGCSTAVSVYAGWIAETLGGDELANGSACIRSSQCRSGVCSLGVCCDRECTDSPCTACSAARGRPESAHGTCGDTSAACDDSNACTLNDHCAAGQCQPGEPKECPAADQCSAASVCDSATGICGDREPLPMGTPCDDSNACTLDDYCLFGTCVASGTIQCAAYECKSPLGNGCMPATGECRYNNREDGLACTDADGKTSVCKSGECVRKGSSGCGAADTGADENSFPALFSLLASAGWLLWQSRLRQGRNRA